MERRRRWRFSGRYGAEEKSVGQRAVSSSKGLETGWSSTVPVVRWAAIWGGVTLQRAARLPSEDHFGDRLAEWLHSDTVSHVRSLVARALAAIEHPRAFALLSHVLNGQCAFTAASAAIGLGRLCTPESVECLKAKARQLQPEGLSGSRSPLPVAVIGALEHAADEAGRRRLDWILRDEELLNILTDALQHALPLTRACAASALGKMRRKEVWDLLQTLVEAGDGGAADMQKVRSSAAYACDHLCFVVEESRFPRLSAFLRDRLRDSSETPEVRRPASSGLVKLARRGHLVGAELADFLCGAQDEDPVVAKNCLLVLTLFPPNTVSERLKLLLNQFDRRHRKLVCSAVFDQPNTVGIRLLIPLLKRAEEAQQPDVMMAAFSAVQGACRKTPEGRVRKEVDWVSDADTISELLTAIIGGSQHPMPQVRASGLTALLYLGGVLGSQKGTNLDPIRADILERVREMLSDPNVGIQKAACYALAGLGDSADLPKLENLARESLSDTLRKAARGAIAFLRRRLGI